MNRKPDGRPEYRSPDERLKNTISEEDWARLPGKGKRLDLREYFQSGEEHRLANKILRDNQILPQHLQDRKEIERIQDIAETRFNSRRNRWTRFGTRSSWPWARLSPPSPQRKRFVPSSNNRIGQRISRLAGQPIGLPDPGSSAKHVRSSTCRHSFRRDQRTPSSDWPRI